MSVTLAMIVKNEEADLPRCVESARPVVDDMVIVDTGSTDGTVRVAEELGARVFHAEWTNDFSAARNAALDLVSTDWVFFLDADEMIARADYAKIRRLAQDGGVDGYFFTQRHYLRGFGYDNWTRAHGQYPEMEGRFEGYTDNLAMRFFRRSENVRYAGRVHEQVVTLDPSRRFATAVADVVIHHYGKVGGQEKTERKKEAYLELGRLKTRDNPEDPQAWYELGIQLHELGRWEECLGCFQKAHGLDRRYDKALYYTGNSLYKLGRLKEARAALEKALAEGGEDADTLVCLAGVERREGEAGGAVSLLERAVTANPDNFAAWFNMGDALLHAGEAERALESFTRALEIMPGHYPAFFGRWQCLALLGEYGPAGAEMLEWIGGSEDLPAMVVAFAGVRLGKGDYETVAKALGPLEDVLGSSAGYAALGAARLGLGEVDGAERALETALGLDESLDGARINLAQLKEIHRKDAASAVALYEEALRRDPGNELCIKKLAALRP